MHDLHEANKILKLVLEEAKKRDLKKVQGIKLGLGNIVEHGELLTAENLAFNIKMLAKGSVAQDLTVEIIKGEQGKWNLIEIEGE